MGRVLMRLRGGSQNRSTLPPFPHRFQPCQGQCRGSVHNIQPKRMPNPQTQTHTAQSAPSPADEIQNEQANLVSEPER